MKNILYYWFSIILFASIIPPGIAEENKAATVVKNHLAQVAQRHCVIPCPERGEKTIVIDGDLAEWGKLYENGIAWHQLFDHTAGEPPAEDPDAAVARILRDDQAFYIAARVRDKSVLSNPHPRECTQGDIFEIYIDTRPLRGKGRLLGNHQYSDGAFQLMCSPAPRNGADLPWTMAFQKVKPIGHIEAKGQGEQRHDISAAAIWPRRDLHVARRGHGKQSPAALLAE